MAWIRITDHGTLLQAGVCPFFLRGYCKFGRRCHKRHVQPEKAARVDDDHLTGQWKIQRAIVLKGQYYETDIIKLNKYVPVLARYFLNYRWCFSEVFE
jgi:hypothetical protein